MFYVNGWHGSKEFREKSESPEGALMFLEAAQEKAYQRLTVMDRAGRRYSEAELRVLVGK